MREAFEELVDEATNELGEQIAQASKNEDEYAEGLEYAVELLQMAILAARGK